MVLVASDSPQLPVGVVEAAFRELGRPDVLGGVVMSTATVLGDVAARAERCGLSVGRVETTFDVDEAEDLERLRPLALARDDPPATRAVFEASWRPAVAAKDRAHTLQEV